MFYAEIDTEKNKYGWDLNCPKGPTPPPSRKYTSTWENLKTVQAKKKRVSDYAEYMIGQEAAATKLEASAPTSSTLGKRVSFCAKSVLEHEATTKRMKSKTRRPSSTNFVKGNDVAGGVEDDKSLMPVKDQIYMLRKASQLAFENRFYIGDLNCRVDALEEKMKNLNI